MGNRKWAWTQRYLGFETEIDEQYWRCPRKIQLNYQHLEKQNERSRGWIGGIKGGVQDKGGKMEKLEQRQHVKNRRTWIGSQQVLEKITISRRKNTPKRWINRNPQKAEWTHQWRTQQNNRSKKKWWKQTYWQHHWTDIWSRFEKIKNWRTYSSYRAELVLE